MHIRESQNAIVARAVKTTIQVQSVERRVAIGAQLVSPSADQPGADVLRAGVQNIGDAVLGK